MEQARLYPLVAEAGAKPLVARAGPIQLARDKVVDALAGLRSDPQGMAKGVSISLTWTPSGEPVCQVLRVSVVSPGPVETLGFGKFRLPTDALNNSAASASRDCRHCAGSRLA
jgi:hypothetical protein